MGVMDLVESLTPVRLVRSLRSGTCPACGVEKGAQVSVCPACYARLTPQLRAGLLNPIGHGYERAMLQALRHLGAARLLLDRDTLTSIRHVPLTPAALGRALLHHSLASRVCPRCAAGKPPRSALCETCRSIIRANAAMVQQGRRAAELTRCLDDIEASILADDPDRYQRAMIQAIRLGKARVFHYPALF